MSIVVGPVRRVLLGKPVLLFMIVIREYVAMVSAFPLSVVMGSEMVTRVILIVVDRVRGVRRARHAKGIWTAIAASARMDSVRDLGVVTRSLTVKRSAMTGTLRPKTVCMVSMHAQYVRPIVQSSWATQTSVVMV